MTDVSRRQFLRNRLDRRCCRRTVGRRRPGPRRRAIEAADQTPVALSADEEALDGSDVFARVIDAKAGQIKIFVRHKGRRLHQSRPWLSSCSGQLSEHPFHDRATPTDS